MPSGKQGQMMEGRLYPKGDGEPWEDFQKGLKKTLACVAQWTECWPANQMVGGSIPSQGTFLHYRRGPQ